MIFYPRNRDSRRAASRPATGADSASGVRGSGPPPSTPHGAHARGVTRHTPSRLTSDSRQHMVSI